jgi:hypothetical protein
MKRDIARLKRELNIKPKTPADVAQPDGMYRIPASEILPDESGYEPQLIKMLRTLTYLQLGERIRRYCCRKAGLEYKPLWILSRESRIRLNEAQAEAARRHLKHIETDPEAQSKLAKAQELGVARMEKRRRIEKRRGRPVAFLYPMGPQQIEKLCDGTRPFPIDNPGGIFWRLTPIYADGTVGDPMLYPVQKPT